MTTKKREYEKPAMQVFMLKQQPQLLAGSGGDGNLNPMGDPYDL
jgi:hypothetical protein